MADISKITLPSGNTYNLKDEGAREAIAALEGGSYFLGVTTTALTDEATTNPIVVDGQSVTATNGNMVIYGKKEFVFNGTKWVEFGDLTTLNSLAYRDTVTLGIGAGDMVLGEATTFTNSSSSVSFSGGSTDVVLGEDTTFTSSTPTITVTPTTTNIKATASGTAVGANGTADAITAFESLSTDTALGTDATFTTTVTPTTTNIKATASGTAVGADGTDTFVKSYPGSTSKLATTTITGTNGTDTATLVSSKVSKKLITTSVPNVTGNDDKTLVFSMGTGNDSETLIISGTGFASNSNTYTASKVTLGTAITAATGSLAATSVSTNVGDTLVASFSTSDKTLAKVASSATTVATGSLDANGGGGSVMTGLGTATTASALTGVKVTSQPTVSLATGATAGTGVISVATGITSASTSVSNNDSVTAITSLGTPTTSTVLTGVKVTTQPTIKLATGATAGTGVISVATGITSATSTTPTITVGTNDKVTAITGIGTGTAAAQTITVGTNDKVKVAKYGDFVGEGITISSSSSSKTINLVGTTYVNLSNDSTKILSTGSYNNRATTTNNHQISSIYIVNANITTKPSESSLISYDIADYLSDSQTISGEGYITINDSRTEAIISIPDVQSLESTVSIIFYTGIGWE